VEPQVPPGGRLHGVRGVGPGRRDR
jgi:hypothetical protein